MRGTDQLHKYLEGEPLKFGNEQQIEAVTKLGRITNIKEFLLSQPRELVLQALKDLEYCDLSEIQNGQAALADPVRSSSESDPEAPPRVKPDKPSR